MHHMHKTTALFLALAAATSCNTETVTLGVTKLDAKAQEANQDTPSVPVANEEANQDPELIVIQSAGRPTTTHDSPSASISHQGAATPEIKSLSITHDKEPLQRVTKDGDIFKRMYRAIVEVEQKDRKNKGTIQKLKNEHAAILKEKEALIQKLKEANTKAQAALQRTIEEKEGNIQTLKNEHAAILKEKEGNIQTLKNELANAQDELKRTSEESALERAALLEDRDKIIQQLKEQLANVQKELQRTSEESALERAARTNDEITLKAIISAGNAVEEKEG